MVLDTASRRAHALAGLCPLAAGHEDLHLHPVPVLQPIVSSRDKSEPSGTMSLCQCHMPYELKSGSGEDMLNK